MLSANDGQSVFHGLNWNEEAKKKIFKNWKGLRLTDRREEGTESLSTFTLLPENVLMLSSQVASVAPSLPTTNKEDDDTVSEVLMEKESTKPKNVAEDTRKSDKVPVSIEESKVEEPTLSDKVAEDPL